MQQAAQRTPPELRGTALASGMSLPPPQRGSQARNNGVLPHAVSTEGTSAKGKPDRRPVEHSSGLEAKPAHLCLNMTLLPFRSIFFQALSHRKQVKMCRLHVPPFFSLQFYEPAIKHTRTSQVLRTLQICSLQSSACRSLSFLQDTVLLPGGHPGMSLI